jgi:hypothetical protein
MPIRECRVFWQLSRRQLVRGVSDRARKYVRMHRRTIAGRRFRTFRFYQPLPRPLSRQHATTFSMMHVPRQMARTSRGQRVPNRPSARSRTRVNGIETYRPRPLKGRPRPLPRPRPRFVIFIPGTFVRFSLTCKCQLVCTVYDRIRSPQLS